MSSDELRIIYLALLAAFEKNCHDMQLVENYISKAYVVDSTILEEFNIRLKYLKDYESQLLPLTKKVFKLWKGGSAK